MISFAIAAMWRRCAFCQEKPNKSKDFAILGIKWMCVSVSVECDITGGLPQGIGFGEREVYILAKGYFWAKVFYVTRKIR